MSGRRRRAGGPAGRGRSVRNRQASAGCRSSVRRASWSAIAWRRLGVDGDVDVRSDAVVGGQAVLQHASCRSGRVQSIRRCDGDRSSCASRGTDRFLKIVSSFAPVSMSRNPVRCHPSVVFGEADVALVHALQPGPVQVVGMGDRHGPAGPWHGTHSARACLATSSSGSSISRVSLDADVPERIGEGGDVVERDRARPRRLSDRRQVTERGRRSHHLPGHARVLVQLTSRPRDDARRTLGLMLSGCVHRGQTLALGRLQRLERRSIAWISSPVDGWSTDRIARAASRIVAMVVSTSPSMLQSTRTDVRQPVENPVDSGKCRRRSQLLRMAMPG